MDNQNNNQPAAAASEPQAQMVPDNSVAETDSLLNPQADKVEAVRQQALQALVPLVDSLQGSPEHKFEILMGALHSSFDVNLLEKALAEALQMEDPSEKAQALVDILNHASDR